METEERLTLSWIGKENCIKEAESKTTKTLKETKNCSINWDSTKNIFIEGDNLDGLKILQKKYCGKIKMIYIDPPYNTGHDFIYRDKLKHSDWCSMMYPRLKLADKLLTNDGVIFISIDDNELFNLKLICDEIFGEDNFVNCIAVKMSETTGVKMTHQMKRFPKIKEYILFYKKKDFAGFYCIDKYKTNIWDKENNIFLENMTENIRKQLISFKQRDTISNKDIEFINNLLKKVKAIPLKQKIQELNISKDKINDWLFENSYRIVKTVGAKSLYNIVRNLESIPEQSIAAELSKDKVLFFYITEYNRNTADPRIRIIFADENLYKNPCDFWQDIKTSGSVSLEGGIKYKNGKKPLKMIKRLIKMTTDNDDIILDFFAGSGTTGHAVMEQNSDDGKNRHFILIQKSEDLDINYKNSKGGNKTDIKECLDLLDKIKKPHCITEITKERLRLSGAEISKKNKNTDIGYKVFSIS